ncbi:T3SS effector HopA1 family protein [Solwaraspora sp. WMMB335]|uniref:T3SS effector HopA1 family protein n=1 Tax=Solwaraspora sp. WMMB335 TaxID=3404118 RepID=UPI003B94B6A6
MTTVVDLTTAALSRLHHRADLVLGGVDEPRPDAIDPLARQMFLTAHCGVDDEGYADRADVDALVDRCRAELGDLAEPITGWRPLERLTSDPDAAVPMLAPDGVRVLVPASSATPGATVGTGWTVATPLLATPTDGRWLYWFSGQQHPVYQSRLYLHLPASTAVDDWLRLIRELARSGLTCQTKISTRLASRPRLDGVVVYLVDHAATRRAVEVVTELIPVTRRGTETAGFALPLAPGVALAARPVAEHLRGLLSGAADFDLSWGFWWARRLAEIAGHTDRASRLDHEIGLLADAWVRTERWWRHGR